MAQLPPLKKNNSIGLAAVSYLPAGEIADSETQALAI
jgi:hypothetical protein